MTQEQIKSLLDSFFISDEDLDARVAFKEFAKSISDILISEFASNYLLNNPNLSVYLAHTDGSMLLKKLKDFLAFTLTAPVDEEYVKRIHFVGSIHYSIKLDPAKVSYGFWAINEILNKMALINEVVENNRVLLSKLLRFIEYLMNEGYYLQRDKQHKNSGVELTNFNAQNELYIGFNMHKLNMEKIFLAAKSEDISMFDGIVEDPSKCIFGKVIHELRKDKKHEFILGFNADEIAEIHNSWHQEYIAIKDAIVKREKEQVKLRLQNLEKLTDRLKAILDATLEHSLLDGQLSLNSGIRAMKKMTNLFYEKNFQEVTERDIELSMSKTIRDVISSELSWAIEDIVIEGSELESSEYPILKQIRYRTKNIFIGIRVKENQKSSYLVEMITLLLEVLDLHLSVKERELSLITFADKAENANKSKDMFLANMSHELRTPLNAITGFSQILMMKKETPDGVKKYIEKINIAGKNLLDLVNTILDFAKLEAGKMQFKPSLSNISDVLNEVRTLVKPLADKKNITLKMPNIISLNLFIDKTLFKQVLINLLTNAVKFTQEGGEVNLMIIYDSDNHKYIFEIKDNGIGLSEESIQKLFQAFSQVDNSYQKEHKGTGLGLMICKKIIEELHKGKIWVESKEGEGSSFFISMSTPMIESHTYSVDESSEDSKSILIVEDSESYQKLLIAHLKDTHKLTITDTINKAKDLLARESYDFIILDFFLTDGISSEILHFMEDENISTPAIVISAEDEIEISSSLAGSSNLECIVNKKNLADICTSLKGGKYEGVFKNNISF